MDQSPFSGLGLAPVTLADQATLSSYLSLLTEPLSDYTFSQLYTWSRSLRIFWRMLEGHLCVFANGSGDLTMLLPPLGDGEGDRALASAYEIMDAYNAPSGTSDRGRIEYASEEMLRRFDLQRLEVTPQGVDYLYDTRRMIDLAGGDLASKRQAKNRFMRNYGYHVQTYDPARHLEPCRALLHHWKQYQDHQHDTEASTNATKRLKESLACEETLERASELGLVGMVVYVNEQGPTGERALEGEGWSLRGFTFGEMLGMDQASIVIEKTDLQVKGLAQYIFSAFCERYWSGRPLINVGDDWGLETLAWTKMSYRPVRLLQKYTLRRKAPVRIAVPRIEAMDPSAEALFQPVMQGSRSEAGEPIVRRATREDVPAAVGLEAVCFSAHCLTKRRLRYLQQRPSAVFLVAEEGGRVIGEGIALVRRHKRGASGRIYSLAVDPACRGQRIGQRLLTAMLENLSARGVGRIYLEVEAANVPARRLYERNGFRAIGVLPNYYGQGHDGVHMLHEIKVHEAPLEPRLESVS